MTSPTCKGNISIRIPRAARRFVFALSAALFLVAILQGGCAGVTSSKNGSAAGQTTSATTSAAPLPTGTTGSGGQLTTNPASLYFNNISVGNNSNLSVTLTNAGSSTITISSITSSGASFTGYGIAVGRIIQPGQVATLNVTFAPTSPGTATGNVTIASNASNSPMSISLLGNGVQLSAGQTYQPGWTDLGSGTQIQGVCPPTNANGNTYDFPFYCGGAVRAWSGGIADTKRNRLIVWGGGHVDYSGNEVYSLNLSDNPPTMTRIWGPGSQVYPNCANEPGLDGVDPSALSDGSPNSRHTWYNLTYIPTADAMFSFTGGLANCGSHTNDTWMLNLSTLQWTQMNPVNGFDPYTGSSTTFSGFFYAVSDYDPNTDTVFVAWSNCCLLQYNWHTNTYTVLSTNTAYPYSSGGVIDSNRKRFWFFGAAYESTTLIAGYVDLTGSDGYIFHDITSSTSGCNGLSPSSRPADGAYPGLAYDSTIDEIVGWPVWGGNTAYIFDPDTLACTTQISPSGPANTSATGVFGRWRYFPGLDVFAVVNDYDQDAYVFKLDGP